MPKQPQPNDPNYLLPIGSNVTERLNQRIAQRQISDDIPFMEVLVPSVIDEAVAQFHSGLGRGMILGHETRREKKFLYIAQADSNTALWMTALSIKREVADLIAAYEPTKSAVLVMVNQTTIQPFLVSPNGTMRSLGVRPVDQTPITLPPDVTFQKEQQGGFYCYAFAHRTLGSLGRILLIPYGPSQMEFKCEVTGPPSDPLMQKRLEIFQPIAHELIDRLEQGLQS